MILYGFWRSSASWRVRILLGLKHLTYEYRPVNLLANGGEQMRPEYAALNPMRQVPLLETREDNGRIVRIAQSLAIAEYLEERFPDPPLFPRERVARAQVRQIAEAINSGIQPLGNTSIRRYVKEVLGGDDDAWSRHWVTIGLSSVETTVSTTAGAFAVGESPTLADACIVPQLFHARRFDVDVERYPTLLRIERSCESIDAFARAHAHRQSDAPSHR
jgi:maleylpyruvate isomerase